MPDTVKVPLLGNVPKGGLFAGGLAVVGVGGYLWWKHQKNQKIAATPVAGATGYAYGYGAAAYGYAQAAFGYGYGPYGYGFGQFGAAGYPGGPYGYAVQQAQTNAVWAQNAVTMLVNQGYTGTAVLAALGKYLSGKPVVQGSADDTTIQAAIAVEGDPPQPGTGGYPPAVNYQGKNKQGDGGDGQVNVRVSAKYDNVTGSWPKVSGATSYNVMLTSHQGAQTIGKATTKGTSYTFHGLKQKQDFAFHVTAEPGGESGVGYTATR